MTPYTERRHAGHYDAKTKTGSNEAKAKQTAANTTTDTLSGVTGKPAAPKTSGKDNK